MNRKHLWLILPALALTALYTIAAGMKISSSDSIICFGTNAIPTRTTNEFVFGSANDLYTFPGTMNGHLINAINVKAPPYSAKGDGLTDDTAAINNALANSGIVFFPPGNYSINARANLVPDMFYSPERAGLLVTNNTTLIFDTKASLTVIPNNSPNYIAILVSGSTNVHIYGGRIVGDRLDSGGRTGEFGYGIEIVNSQDVTVEGLTSVDNWGDGIYIGTNGTNLTSRITVRGCTFQNNYRNNLSISNCDGVRLLDSVFTGANGTAPQAGIDIEPELTYDALTSLGAKNVTVSGCTVTSNSFSGIDVWSSDTSCTLENIKIQGCLLSQNGNSGVNGGGNSLVISHNHVINNATNGLYLTTLTNSVVSENVITNNGIYGLYLYRAFANSICENIFEHNSADGPFSGIDFLLDAYCARNSITANTFSSPLSSPAAQIHLSQDINSVNNSFSGNSFSKGYSALDVRDTSGTLGVAIVSDRAYDGLVLSLPRLDLYLLQSDLSWLMGSHMYDDAFKVNALGQTTMYGLTPTGSYGATGGAEGVTASTTNFFGQLTLPSVVGGYAGRSTPFFLAPPDDNNGYFFGANLWVTSLCSDTETYLYYMGLSDSAATNLPVTGVGLLYDRNKTLYTGLSTNNWILMSANASTYTFSDTGVPVSTTDGGPVRFQVSYLFDKAVCFTNGLAACTNTANLPASGTWLYLKSQGYRTVGSTARAVRYADWRFHERRSWKRAGL